MRGWQAKGELEAAVPLASQVQDDLKDGDLQNALTTARSLVDHAQKAADLTSDPIWRAAELLPIAGVNLTAVRQSAEVTNLIASQAVYPIVSDVSGIGVDSFRPVGGAINLEPLIEAQPAVSAAHSVLSTAEATAATIPTEGTLDEVSSAVLKLRESVGRANTLMDGVDRAVTLIPRMLGAQGSRNYLLTFQNPAELRAGGGITSALAQISTNNGSVQLVQQASGSDFPEGVDPVIDLPPETLALYGDRAATYVQNATLVPQFDLSGQISARMWQQRYGTAVDGVISFDPIGLSYLLSATGPVNIPAVGVTLTADNAVSFLLSDVYRAFPDPEVQDAVFAVAAKAIFDQVAEGDLDPARLLNALIHAGNEGRIKIWSGRAEDQDVLAGTTLAGGLPAHDQTLSTVGVYFNDATGAKMDYYLQTGVLTRTATCRPDGRLSVKVEVTLGNTAPNDATSSLPEYVTGRGAYGVTPGNVKTIVYVYSPLERNPNSPTLITDLDPGKDGLEAFSARDQNHLVAGFPVELAPGESRTVSVTYVVDEPDSPDVRLSATPTINPTVYATEINRSFSGC